MYYEQAMSRRKKRFMSWRLLCQWRWMDIRHKLPGVVGTLKTYNHHMVLAHGIGTADAKKVIHMMLGFSEERRSGI
jgi:hypothetical protein